MRGREMERKRQPNHWPDTFFVKAIMVRAVDDFVVDSFRSVTRSFLFLFFVTLMILNYCLMIYRIGYIWQKWSGRMVYSTQNNKGSSFVDELWKILFLAVQSAKWRGAAAKKWSIKTHRTHKKFHLCSFLQKNSSLHSKILQLSVLFSPSVRKKVSKVCFVFWQRHWVKKSTSSTKHTRHYNDTPYIKLRRASILTKHTTIYIGRCFECFRVAGEATQNISKKVEKRLKSFFSVHRRITNTQTFPLSLPRDCV